MRSSKTEGQGKAPALYSYIPERMVTWKIKPDFNVVNDNNISIVSSMASMYTTPKDRLGLKKGLVTYASPSRSYFDMHFKPKQADFYMTAPNNYTDLVENSMKTTWNRSEIRKVSNKDMKKFDPRHTEVCEIVLRDYNFKSLNTGRGNLYPLTNMLSVVNSLRTGEQVRVNIAIEPTRRKNWIDIAKDEYKNYKKGHKVDNEMSTKDKLVKLGFMGAEGLVNLYIEFRMLLFESIFGIIIPEKKEDNQKIELKIDSLESAKQENIYIGLSPSTIYKMTAAAFKTRITILSESKDSNRAKLNMLSVANAYKDLNEDNELVVRILSKHEQESLFKSVMDYNVPTSKKCVCSDKEISKLIQLPQKDLQNEYKIDAIDTREVDVPRVLQGGKVRICEVEKQGRKIIATWSTNKNIMALAKLWVGPQNCGKTTAIKRTVKETHKAGDSNMVIDYIESCETAREIAEVIPDNEKVLIKLGTKDHIPALAYNEVSRLITEDMDPWERVRLANLIAEQVEYLINAVTDSSTGELTAPMLRYLHAACMVIFIKPGAKVGEVFDILRRWDRRNEAIRYAKYSKCFDEDDDIFFDLDELHDRDTKGKIIGTREHLISGVTNRITILKKNPYIKEMLKADIDTSQDLSKYIEEGKSVFIMIPQTLFPNPMIRDILTTFFISRIWLTVQMRENNADARLCHVIFDEVHQVPTTAKFLSNHITEFRRHRLGLMLSCHFLKQFRSLLTALKSSGVSYVLIAGTEKENLEMLKEELAPFTVEEGLSLKEHQCLNIINYGNQYAKFIGRLPKH